MCLAIPCKIIEIDNSTAIIEIGGVNTEASLLLIEDPKIGEYVIVHAGFAIHKIDEKEAMEALKALREITAISFEEESES
ncbi:HypC/HybG/HupF family hydrogenase formation chaperone [Thermodesulfobacteriota bacterium]